ncbi:hypothetical protein KAK07_05860 [Ideonella sp. 4Y16]|uniref:Uncharacterized protein n=1 Tax=Ideonella alba TaxID=2824118 RepID=A0A940Y9M7_9BURK|nr:hypothetical protein [Ideonella alba]MBQ0928916.1 hypothetical protein [Ideonella alba]MBQ0942851.1 hypothetical protein [Ideonella alba]
MIPALNGFRSTTGIAVARARPAPRPRPPQPARFRPAERALLLAQPGIGRRTLAVLEAAGVGSLLELLLLEPAEIAGLALTRPAPLLQFLDGCRSAELVVQSLVATRTQSRPAALAA